LDWFLGKPKPEPEISGGVLGNFKPARFAKLYSSNLTHPVRWVPGSGFDHFGWVQFPYTNWNYWDGKSIQKTKQINKKHEIIG